jgi:hypothetical protein
MSKQSKNESTPMKVLERIKLKEENFVDS